MTFDSGDLEDRDRLMARVIELAIPVFALALLLYWSLILVRPFVTIVIWSIVLAVAIDPVFEWISRGLGGRRRLAAVLVTGLTLLVVVGPVAWLVLSLIESLRTLSAHLGSSDWALPPPPQSVKGWPMIGEQLYRFWDLASTNIREAWAKVAPQLKPIGNSLLHLAGGAGAGFLKLLASIVIAGFLLAPARSLVDAATAFARRLSPHRGEEFVRLAGATIRNISLGVVGISALQASLASIGLIIAGVPGSALITSAVLICGIIQIGPSIVLMPLIIWSWFAMDTTSALLFTAYMLPVNLLDNVLRPFVMGRGLKTPMPVILLGVFGGTLAYGITGLFLGPIVLALIWELSVPWVAAARAE
jgi:predicted PurR-regulated permease PerM